MSMTSTTFKENKASIKAWRGWKKLLLGSWQVAGFPIMIFVLGQYLDRILESHGQVQLWWHLPFYGFDHHSLQRNLEVLGLNWIVLTAFWLPVLLISRRPKISMLFFSLLYCLMVVANALKLNYRAEPLLPWDITMLWQMLPLASSYLLSARVFLLLPLIVALLIYLVGKRWGGRTISISR